MPNATEEQKKALESMGLTAQEIANMDAETLKNKLADQQAALKQEMAMENMKAQLMQALLPLGEAFSKIFAALTPILKVIAGLFKVIGFLIELILSPLELIYSFFNEIETVAEEIFSGFGKFLDGDFAGGFMDIASGLVRLVLSPVQAVIDMAIGVGNFLIGAVNNIPMVDIPLIPSFNLTDTLMGLQDGGTVTRGGAFVVGEAGPEVVNLEPGDAVTPNNQLAGANGANGADGAAGQGMAIDYNRMAQAFAKAVAGVKLTTPPVQIGANTIREISAEADIQRSYRASG